MARLTSDIPGHHPDTGQMSGDTYPGQTRTPPYKGVHMSGCPVLKPSS